MSVNVFLSGYWETNFGDDLFVKIICEKYPNVNFFLETSKKDQIVFSKITNLKIFNKRKDILSKIIRRLTQKNSVYYKHAKSIPNFVELGGSIFILPSNMRDRRVLNNRKAIRLICDKYLVIGSNFGPYYFEEQIEEYQSFFNDTDGVVFRDSYSFDLFAKNQKVKQASDIVFSLDTKNYLTEKKEENIVISIIDLSWRKEKEACVQYENYLSETIIDLIDKGKTITLMSFCEKEGDTKAAKRIFNYVPEKYRKSIIIYTHNSIETSLNLISKSEAIIATRFHAMILGWVFKKPTYALCYSNKMNNVISDAFPEQNYINISDITEDTRPITYQDFSIISKENLDLAIKSSRDQFFYFNQLV